MSQAVTTEREYAAGAFHKAVIYYLNAPDTGSQTFSVNHDDVGGIANVHIIVEAYSGVKTSSPLDTTNTGSGSTDPSVSVDPSENHTLIVDAAVSEANNVLTNASGQILTHDHDFRPPCNNGKLSN